MRKLNKRQLRRLIESSIFEAIPGGRDEQKAARSQRGYEKGKEMGKEMSKNIYLAETVSGIMRQLFEDVAPDRDQEVQFDDEVGNDAMKNLTKFLKEDPVWSVWYKKAAVDYLKS